MFEQEGKLSRLKSASGKLLHRLTSFLLIPNWQLLSEDDWLLRMAESDPEITDYLYHYEARLLDEPWLLGKPWLS
jgi:hypothetical protein